MPGVRIKVTSRHHSEGDSRARQGFRNEVIALKVANEHVCRAITHDCSYKEMSAHSWLDRIT